MNILVVAAHSDDEVLGIGGAIARFRREGHAVSVMFMTDGTGSRAADPAAAARRRNAAEKAAQTLGYKLIAGGSYPDNQMDAVPLLDIVKTVERAKAAVRPERVLTHFWGDLNIDHRRTFEAVVTAFRPHPGEVCRSICAFEVASSTEWAQPDQLFRPNRYLELTTGDVDRALAAYQAYEEETRPDPHTRSTEAFRIRRALRGREVGCAWAEALMVVRDLA